MLGNTKLGDPQHLDHGVSVSRFFVGFYAMQVLGITKLGTPQLRGFRETVLWRDEASRG